MKVAAFVAILLILLLAFRAAWRVRPTLGLGITFGILAVCVVAAFAKLPEFDSVPLWLPPLPFAVVAATLFAFGILAWVWGDEHKP